MRATKLVTISLSPNLLRKAEKAAREENRTRSELLREALRRYLEDREWRKIYRYGERRARSLGLDEEDIERLVDEIRTALKVRLLRLNISPRKSRNRSETRLS